MAELVDLNNRRDRRNMRKYIRQAKKDGHFAKGVNVRQSVRNMRNGQNNLGIKWDDTAHYWNEPENVIIPEINEPEDIIIPEIDESELVDDIKPSVINNSTSMLKFITIPNLFMITPFETLQVGLDRSRFRNRSYNVTTPSVLEEDVDKNKQTGEWIEYDRGIGGTYRINVNTGEVQKGSNGFGRNITWKTVTPLNNARYRMTVK